MQQPFVTGNGVGDQMMRWSAAGDGTGYVDGANNSYGLVPAQPQFTPPVATPTNSLARRQMNRALVPANPRGGFESPTDPWTGFPGDENSLLQQNPAENSREEDNIELLEEMASKAKREAQSKRKQIPPFVQKLSR